MNSEAKEAIDSDSDGPSDEQFDLDSSDFDVSDNEPTVDDDDDDKHRIRIHVKADQTEDDNNNNTVDELPTKTILKINGDSFNASMDNGFYQAVNIIVPTETVQRVHKTTIVQITGTNLDETDTDLPLQPTIPTPPPPPPLPPPQQAVDTKGDLGADQVDADDDENAVIVDFLGKANELVGPLRWVIYIYIWMSVRSVMVSLDLE